MQDQSNKKDYQGPLYAPWSDVVAGWSEERRQAMLYGNITPSSPHMSEAFMKMWKSEAENEKKGSA